jgi:hypothetical protein
VALGERFIVILADGRTVEADTWRSFKHSLEVQPTKYRVETGVKPIDHAVLEPKTSSIEAVYSDTPLDPTIAPGGPFRSQRCWLWLQEAAEARNPVQVYAGLRYYPAAILTSLGTDESLSTAGSVVASISIQEFLSTQSLVVRTVKRKAKQKKKVQNGQKFADKIKAVAAGTQETIKQ